MTVVFSRRTVIARFAMWAGLLSSYGTAGGFALRFLYPRKQAPRLRSIYVARLADLPDGGARRFVDLRGAPVQVLRRGDRVLALSTVCPHLGCQVHWEGDKQRFLCPCHNAVFDAEGNVVSGPPPRGLDRYEAEVLGGGVYLTMKEPTGS